MTKNRKCPNCNSLKFDINIDGDKQCNKCGYINLSIKQLNRRLNENVQFI